MLAYDNAAPIERFGRTWKPWTKQQLIEMAARLPLSKFEQLTVGYNDMIRYVGSIRGLDHALAIAGNVPESEVAKLGEDGKVKLVGELLDRMIGAYMGSGTEEPDRPLVATAPTGQ